MSLKERAAALLTGSGILPILERLPTQPGLIVFNHHRIGDRERCAYDRGLFSATAEQFEAQVAYIKEHFPVLLPHQVAEVMANRTPLQGMHAMITFDDGYLDNYSVAYPILKRHQVPAAFYLVSDFVGTGALPWWDVLAYTARHCRKGALELSWCDERPLRLGPDVEAAIQTLVRSFKSDRNTDPEASLAELREASGVEVVGEGRRFLDWGEAREMMAGGMEMGAHTRTHPIISKLPAEAQRQELRVSKQSLEEHLGGRVGSFAYPNGSLHDFTPETMALVAEEGYSTAFSFYGGINRNGWGSPFNLLRVSPDPRPGSFRLDAVLSSRLAGMDTAMRRTFKRLRAA